MAKLKGLQDVNTIQQRLISTIKGNPETIIEGSFKRDIINATAEEFKNAYFEIDLVKDAAFAATSWGEYLTAKCSDMGIDRKLAKLPLKVTLTPGFRLNHYFNLIAVINSTRQKNPLSTITVLLRFRLKLKIQARNII